MNTETKKITKKMYYSTIEQIVEYAQSQGVGLPDGITYEGIGEFIAHEQELLDNKTAAAAKRAAQKKENGDQLRQRIEEILGEEPQTLDEIVAALGDANVTNAMVTPRLTQLVKLGVATKETLSVASANGEKSRKKSGYRKV